MIANTDKGWYGSFSLAGKCSAERSYLIMHQDEIFAADYKRKFAKEMFRPDDPLSFNLKNLNLNLYKQYSSDLMLPNYNDNTALHNKKAKSNSAANMNTKGIYEDRELITPNDKLKYHKGTIERIKSVRKKMIKKPNERVKNKYIPLLNESEKNIIGLKWNKAKIKAERLVFAAGEGNSVGYYIGHKPIELFTGNFIDMNLQTQRGNFAGNFDVRMRTDKVFSPLNNSNNNYDTHDKNNNNNDNNDNNNQSISKLNHSNTVSSDSLQIVNHSKKVKQQKEKHFLKFSKTFNSFNLEKTINNFKISNKNCNSKRNTNTKKSPDFQKMLSRDYLNKIKLQDKKIHQFTDLQPNYDKVLERQISMVKYDKSIHSKNHKGYREKIMINLGGLYDASKTFNFVKRNTGGNGPNFNLMTSRPNNLGSLPSYMSKIYNRQASFMMTDKTLQLNNFSNGKFIKASTVFTPKKSFNFYINKSQEPPQLQKVQTYSCLKFDYFINNCSLPKIDGLTCKNNTKSIAYI